MQCRAFLLFNCLQNFERIEDFDRNHGGTMSDAGHDTEYAAETVEKRYRNTEPVLFGKLHALADIEAVVDNIVMGQHDPFGETGRTGGVLHVDDFVTVKSSLHGNKFSVADRFTQLDDSFKIHHSSRSFSTDENNIFQERQSGCPELPGGRCCQFRNNLVHGGNIIGILERVDHEERR